MLDDYEEDQEKMKSAPPHGKGSRGKRKADKVKSPEFMALRRRKLWAMMSKKELAKVTNWKILKGLLFSNKDFLFAYRVKDQKEITIRKLSRCVKKLLNYA